MFSALAGGGGSGGLFRALLFSRTVIV